MTEAATNAGGLPGGPMGGTVIYLVLMVVIFYFLLIRPQKKREKQTRMMLNEMRPGDEVVTIGGVMGNIVNIKEDRVVIETGANRTKLTFEKSAIKTVLTVHEDEEEYEIEEEE
jgi:preprotein translocase subunit YajC